MKLTKRRLALIILSLAAVALSLLAFLPQPVPVEAGRAAYGPLRESVDEEGETRARDRYTVAAPVAGQLERVALREGDPVRRGQEVARLRLAPLDPREQAAAEARLRAAEALRNEAGEGEARARAEAEQAARERTRAEELSAQGLIALQQLEQAKIVETAAAKAREAARFRARASAAEVEVAKAALLAAADGGGGRVLPLAAPADGRVLRVLEQSERVLPAGTPLLLLGDPARLEVVVEVLTTDAVRMRPGMPVLLAGWGGERELRARLRAVEPAAFTKVSALGVEEQRVRVVADFEDPPGPLGDGYRVEARIVTWESARVLQAPASALFRQGAGWAVFAVDDGRARLRPVEAGHRTPAAVEIRSGLAEGVPVVLHPPNELADGARVSVR